MRPPALGWLVIGATLALALWGAVALVKTGAALARGDIRPRRPNADSLLVTDRAVVCEPPDMPHGIR
jgi:hypothetical protein